MQCLQQKRKPVPTALKRASFPFEIICRNLQKRKLILGKVAAVGTKGAHEYWKEEIYENAKREREGEKGFLEVTAHIKQLLMPWSTHQQFQEVYRFDAAVPE